ncbi:Vi polysaccharide biosynthesis UDP-N-acetylglucosamine C-6 dehydrogenase TviB [Reichenbachiella sp.]|uniref:Vi polysaccharide biosynthesis UDP-N-acetylglucosamine C-6 dehydrogenase TviB n=1 Tax=Reichenbachiella sp. TaxID=2184521 RepID=UPI003B5BF598
MKKIGVIGLGYVGLPLAVEFGKKRQTIGFDINVERISELKTGIDRTLEVSSSELREADQLIFSSDINDLKSVNIFIITVPTPINKYKQPVLKPLVKASETVGEVLKKGDIVIYESTVYPGCTEEDCVPVLEKVSGLKFNTDFYCGYSPERINPGDKEHRLSTIMKVTSGSSEEVATEVDNLYKEIITAGTHRASSIKVAEAAKVIENSQRDLNIAFVNELSIIFHKMGIDTTEVLEAAGTKWNFLKFKPGLVGGHCIGVDPYYLTSKAESLGYHPQVITAGRRINDGVGSYVASEVIKLMIDKGQAIKGASVLVLGVTFKENCPDIRNSKVIDVIEELSSFGANVDVYDPQADFEEVHQEYGIKMISEIQTKYCAIVLTVSHNEFLDLDIENMIMNNAVVYDIKGFLNPALVDKRL